MGIPELPAPSDVIREFMSGLREAKQESLEAQRDYYRRYLTADYDKPPILTLGERAYIRISLAQVLDEMGNEEESQEELEHAGMDACASGEEGAIYRILMFSCRRATQSGNLEAAADFCMKSIRYSRVIWPHNLHHTLRTLGDVLSNIEGAGERAMMAYDWLILVEQAPLGAMIARAELRLRMGRRDVLQAAANAKTQSCLDIAESVAANSVLRRSKKAREAANSGLLAAKAAGDSRWEGAFQWFLDREKTR